MFCNLLKEWLGVVKSVMMNKNSLIEMIGFDWTRVGKIDVLCFQQLQQLVSFSDASCVS